MQLLLQTWKFRTQRQLHSSLTTQLKLPELGASFCDWYHPTLICLAAPDHCYSTYCRRFNTHKLHCFLNYLTMHLLGKALRHLALFSRKNHESKLVGYIKCLQVLSFPTGNSGSRVRLQKSWQSSSRAEVGNSRDSSSTPISRDRWTQIDNNFCSKPSSSALELNFTQDGVLYNMTSTTWEGSHWIFGRISQCTNWRLDSYFHNLRNTNILSRFYFSF